MKVDMTALNKLIEGLRAQSSAFASNDSLRCLNVSDKSSGCFMDQGNVIEKNGHIRTFDRYDTNAMCATCAAYWHIDRALSTLRDLKAIAENFGAQQ
jgi:hypothetical protein